MFLENDYARPLFDFEKGGSPKAFQCLCTPCNKVTRTERGMRMHLKIVHNWKEQPCLFSTEGQKPVERNRRQNLRMSDISRAVDKTMSRFSIQDTEPEAGQQAVLLQLTEPEKKEGGQ